MAIAPAILVFDLVVKYRLGKKMILADSCHIIPNGRHKHK